VPDKRATFDDVVAEVRDGMTVGIGGWGSRRKPMSIVRAIARSGVRDLTVVSYGGPDVGILCAAGAVRKVVFGFVTLDSTPLEPNFRRVRESGAVEARELDEGMLYWGLFAAATRMPFLPLRSGLGSDVLRVNPDLQAVRSPYGGEELVAMPPIELDVALVHVNRSDANGAGQVLGPDLYFDDVFLRAAQRRFVSCERVVPTEDLVKEGSVRTLRIYRSMVDGVVEAPRGAHFTSCPPDYDRDEDFQREYAKAAADPDAWKTFRQRYVDVEEDEYHARVRRD
jgi:acyl CoA:acetate/3-ketoacid CoA transferase alpha subunit